MITVFVAEPRRGPTIHQHFPAAVTPQAAAAAAKARLVAMTQQRGAQ